VAKKGDFGLPFLLPAELSCAAMKTAALYQAILAAPFGTLGVCCTESVLLRVQFLPPDMPLHPPVNLLSEQVCQQILAYCGEANFVFDLPLQDVGTLYQRKVWQAMCAIPLGKTRTYGQLAAQLNSSPRAVGQACGANPVPIIVPCHRIVSQGGVGGFMHHRGGYALDIKRWLLAHETVENGE
jgi:methylated-DNA-[protein]-cysteine S-methyltransferase